jgi:PAS domain S-box-containing protein
LFDMPPVDVRTEGLRLVHETLLGEAVMAGGLPVVVTDEALRYLAVNEAACAFLGYSRAELLQLSVPEVVARPAGELVESAQRVVREGSHRGTTVVRRADGSVTDIGFVTFPTAIAAMNHLVTVWWELSRP